MNKHHHKRKKVIIDVLDGKIINDHQAIKVSNIDEYLEKNGYRMIKLFLLALIFASFIPYAHAEGFDAGAMTRLDLSITTNIYLLIAVFGIAVFLILVGIKQGSFIFFLLGDLIWFFTGLILAINGFVVVLSILLCIAPLILIFLWKGD